MYKVLGTMFFIGFLLAAVGYKGLRSQISRDAIMSRHIDMCVCASRGGVYSWRDSFLTEGQCNNGQNISSSASYDSIVMNIAHSRCVLERVKQSAKSELGIVDTNKTTGVFQ